MSIFEWINGGVQAIARNAGEIVAGTPWGAWRDFWLTYIFDDRMLVVWCLPLVPVLWLASARHRAATVIATGLLIAAYVWGVAFALIWVGILLLFYRLAEAFAVECRRTDVNPLGPPLVAGALIVFAHLAFFNGFRWVRLPDAAEAGLHQAAPWLYAIGSRGFSWEPPNYPGVDPKRVFDTFSFYFAHLVGTAYLIIRLTHYFAEIRKGTIRAEDRSLTRFFAWLCYAPNMMQGPIERYHEFQVQLGRWHEQRSLIGTLYGLWRIAMGVFKSVVSQIFIESFIAELLIPGGVYYRAPWEIRSDAFLYFGVFLQIFNLYLQFSGYCDASAGIASILGYRQIENFAMPWFATSLRDFWRRWHISLSLLLRDHVYIPLGGSRTGVPVLNLMLTFGICGLWHAYLLQMLLWGVLMGLMLWVNQVWAEEMARLDLIHKPPGGDDPKAAARAAAVTRTPARLAAATVRSAWLRLWPLPTVCAWLVTQHAFVFSLVIFFGGADGVRVIAEILGRFGSWVWGLM